jgi:serine/threonine protein kinase
LRQLAEVGMDIARGMGYLHSLGILHLDIKPSNVLMEKDVRQGRDAPRAVLADLGIARRLKEGKDYALVDGIRYSSPVQS